MKKPVIMGTDSKLIGSKIKFHSSSGAGREDVDDADKVRDEMLNNIKREW